ncbi:AAA family ATPase [Deinococcus malanensis]|uniref:AAA family ATPase n=1 Tax=Deinococcus malanensis TaxID=1706855 RepID=UPI003642AC3D
MELVVLMGLPGSGKTTFYRSCFATTHVQVGKDLFPNNRNKARRQQHLLEAALAGGLGVVLDNTNPTMDDRAAPITLAHTYGAAVIGYVFPVTLPAPWNATVGVRAGPASRTSPSMPRRSAGNRPPWTKGSTSCALFASHWRATSRFLPGTLGDDRHHRVGSTGRRAATRFCGGRGATEGLKHRVSITLLAYGHSRALCQDPPRSAAPSAHADRADGRGEQAPQPQRDYPHL